MKKPSVIPAVRRRESSLDPRPRKHLRGQLSQMLFLGRFREDDVINYFPILKLAVLVLSFSIPVAAQVKNPDTYTYAYISDADSLDPAWSYDVASYGLILNIYEPLFWFHGSSTEKLDPLLATIVPSRINGLISADGKTYRIPIRKGIHFQDGAPMTPEDVRYSIMRFILLDRDAGPSPLLMLPLLGYPSTRDDKGNLKPNCYKDAARAIQIEGDAIVLHLPKPYAPLLTILAQWAPIVSKQWAIKNDDWDGTEAALPKYNNFKKESSPFFERANGTGPFMLERWDRKTMQAVLKRNDHYWRPPARLARVIMKGINEFGTRKLMFEAGDADNIYADWPDYSQIQNIPGVEIFDNQPTMEMNPTAFFTLRVEPRANPYIGSGRLDGEGIPPDFFSDVNVRKAFAYAFDYKGYIKDVFRGHGTQATGCIPKSLPGHNPNQKTHSLDLSKSREYFQKAFGGKVWENGFKFSLVFNSGNVIRQNFCQIMKRDIESLNPKFKIDVRSIEWPTFLDSYKNSKLPIFVMGWQADYPDADDFAFPMMHSQGSFPVSQKYKNPAADRLIEEAVSETDIAKRKRLYFKIQEIEFEDVPHLVLVDTVKYRAQRTWVKGWHGNPVFPDSPWGSYYYPMYKAASAP